MTNNEPDVLVRRFLDRELAEEEVKEALHRIADDKEARDLLQFELEMTQDLASSRSGQPPRDFADRTMDALAQEPAPGEESATLLDRMRALWQVATGTVELQVRPLSAAMTVMIAGVVAWLVVPIAPTSPNGDASSRLASGPQSQPVQQTATHSTAEQTVWIRFMYTDNDADSVAVAGDFSQWEPVSLSPREVQGKTVWTGLVPVSRGEHEYQFLINGERWVTDPLAPVKRSDGFGAKNAVLNI